MRLVNSIVVDGIDNNRKDVTGPEVYVTPEAVSEFSLLQNQYSAECHFFRTSEDSDWSATRQSSCEMHEEARGQ